MNKKLFLFCITAFCFLHPCISFGKTLIDSEERACVDKAASTVEIMQCTQNAYKAWDSEMNNYYNLLMKILNPDQQSELLKAQKNWLSYRDNDFSFISDSVENKQGTIYMNIAGSERRDVVKQRATRLKEYYLILTDNYLNQPD